MNFSYEHYQAQARERQLLAERERRQEELRREANKHRDDRPSEPSES